MTFKFSYCFVLELVTKVLISCLLEVLTSRQLRGSDLREGTLQAPGVCTVLGVPMKECIFPLKKKTNKNQLLLHIAIKCLLCARIVTMTNKKSKTIILVTPTHQHFIY